MPENTPKVYELSAEEKAYLTSLDVWDDAPLAQIFSSTAAVTDLPSIPTLFQQTESMFQARLTKQGGDAWSDYHQLIYAYLIENTGMEEIFRRLCTEFLHGERLGTLTNKKWLTLTEALVFSDPGVDRAVGVASRLRPDSRLVRRNAYMRMFGMDLDFPAPAEAVKPTAFNAEFADTMTRLLREVWVGIENRDNDNGIKPTDDQEVLGRLEALKNMMADRRRDGNLLREEFHAVATMGWLHKTLIEKSPTSIMKELKADASSPTERLKKLGEMVGMKPHPKADSFLHLAPAMSIFLKYVETKVDVEHYDVNYLWETQELRKIMMTIITHWSATTGIDIKKGASPMAQSGYANGNGTFSNGHAPVANGERRLVS